MSEPTPIANVPVDSAPVVEAPTTKSEPNDDSEYQAALAKARGIEPDAKPKAEAKPEEKPSDSSEEIDKESNPNDSFKLKVNGEEVEIKSRDEMVRLAQLGMASNKKFEEASKLRKDAEGFITRLKSDPLSILQHPSLGINFDEIAEQHVWNKLQAEQMTPQEREFRANQQELEQYRAQEAKLKQENDARASEEMAEKYRQDWSVKFKSAIEQGGLPSTDWTVSRMAGYMREALQRGMDIEPADVVHLVKQDFIKAQQQFYSSMDPDAMIQVLGADTVDKIRKHQVSQYKQAQSQPVKTAAQPTQNQGRTYSSVDEMREAMNRR